ncbi:MAG: histidinol dehydrogenase [Acidobacteriota bacterium]|nr:histidinol dehydrogenase [Acidobacteriota bacterium]
MIRIVDAEAKAGKRELEILLRGRRGGSPDFTTLKQILPIVEDVLRNGEPALRRWVKRFEPGFSSPAKKIFLDPSSRKPPEVDRAFAAAFRVARKRVEAYHRKQLASASSGFSFKDALGVSFVEKPVPFDSVGVYVPGGRAFYPSSLLMGVVPARIAGVRRIVVATPRGAWAGSPELRWAAAELGVDEVLLAGGAHGIAGLVSVSGVAKIVGPGNRFVAAAKHLVSGLVAVDMPAGPSEVLIVASDDADPALVAADLLAQAEHDPDAVCLLFSDSKSFASDVRVAVASQMGAFEETVSSKVNAATARASLLGHGRIFTFKEISSAVSAGSCVAAEHVQVMGRRAERLASSLLSSAGALFIGSSTPTALGDYVLGPNHVLPTGGAARSFSGLSVRDFLRWGRSVCAPERAARRLAPQAATLARFEGLVAHASALDRRTP